jgi:hypothetical protein
LQALKTDRPTIERQIAFIIGFSKGALFILFYIH